jgi:hypothetical protein
LAAKRPCRSHLWLPSSSLLSMPQPSLAALIPPVPL